MSRSKRKGSRIELEIVHRHQAAGIAAMKQPLSGALGGDLAGDVLIDGPHGQLRGEVKARRSGAGFQTLERWLGSNDLLFLRRDRAEPIVAMRFDTYLALMAPPEARTAALTHQPATTLADAPLGGRHSEQG